VHVNIPIERFVDGLMLLVAASPNAGSEEEAEQEGKWVGGCPLNLTSVSPLSTYIARVLMDGSQSLSPNMVICGPVGNNLLCGWTMGMVIVLC
jgi:hypothetical protein